ncbi:ATP-binding cassette domain-containing protein [Phytoactinopolyspora limicola]|uniref:ATP-binding cassette domain-containing protein n=1 Tax=Phytoactinopolyspora limicola TaxID=2715536 RepID=UPI00140C83AE|nr:ATP-binding cassette domain-containing protein [Phytoactinopolyspora limicola]
MNGVALANQGPAPLLRVDRLHVDYEVGRAIGGWPPGRRRTRVAVRDVSFEIASGETFGLVGESGSGKSTTGRAILRLVTPAAGAIAFDGREITTLGKNTPMWYRRAVQVVFQDPLASLNPRHLVGNIVEQAVGQRSDAPGRAGRRRRARELLDQVGLAGRHAERFPYELSGGQQQRVAIARALAVDPRLIICDEAVSALDVSTQGQIVNLLGDLQRELGLSLLFISHDLAVVRHLSHRVGVLRLGELVESGPADQVYNEPRHPYTRSLLDSVLVPDPVAQRERRLARRTRAVPRLDDLEEEHD